MRANIVALLIFASIAQSAAAQCESNVLSTQTSSNLNVTMVTMNRLGSASYADGSLKFIPGSLHLRQVPHWVTVGPMPQQFSDRFVALPSGQIGAHPGQNFDVNQADLISLTFTTGASPQGTITLNSHGNGMSSFPITCSSTGIVHGVTGDVEYLFYFSPEAAPQ